MPNATPPAASLVGRHELPGFGDHSPLFIDVDPPRRFTVDARDPARSRRDLAPGDEYMVIHVISKPAGGEVRGYVLAKGVAFVRYPTTPRDWPEVDAALASAIGVTINHVPQQQDRSEVMNKRGAQS